LADVCPEGIKLGWHSILDACSHGGILPLRYRIVSSGTVRIDTGGQAFDHEIWVCGQKVDDGVSCSCETVLAGEAI
jgi:hypothetical protein